MLSAWPPAPSGTNDRVGLPDWVRVPVVPSSKSTVETTSGSAAVTTGQGRDQLAGATPSSTRSRGGWPKPIPGASSLLPPRSELAASKVSMSRPNVANLGFSRAETASRCNFPRKGTAGRRLLALLGRFETSRVDLRSAGPREDRPGEASAWPPERDSTSIGGRARWTVARPFARGALRGGAAVGPAGPQVGPRLMEVLRRSPLRRRA